MSELNTLDVPRKIPLIVPRRVPTTNPNPASLETIQRQLSAIMEQEDRAAAFAALVQRAAELTNAVAVFYHMWDASGQLVEGPARNMLPADQDEALRAKLNALAAAASRQQKLLFESDAESGLSLICVPVDVPTADRECLSAALALGYGDPEPFVVMLLMIASYGTLWHVRRVSRDVAWEAQATAAIAELVSKVESSGSRKAGCQIIVDELSKFLTCERAAIAVRRGEVCELYAVSGAVDFDRAGETGSLLQAALDETLVRDALTVWPPVESSQRHALLAHGKLAEQLKAETVITAPLRRADGEVVATWLCYGTKQQLTLPRIRFQELAGAFIGSALDVVRRAEESPLQRLRASLARGIHSWRLRGLVAALVLLAGILAVPLPYKIRGHCILEPSARRFAVTPYEGVLRASHVKPGDVVTQDQSLATMDDREIKWELTGVLAERERALKLRDRGLAQHDIPGAQMAQLDAERLDLKLRLLRHRESNLEIKSPVEGVVLSGELEAVEGAPVELGQALFEVALLDTLKLEVEIPEEDVALVRTGMEVSVRLDAFPSEPRLGTISNIHPRAVVRRGGNVFVAEATLENSGLSLRPGMNGRAKIRGESRSLAWILFHRSWSAVTRTLGW